ncbi:DNA-binding MurR/RpiR family transcriptional regulator [Pseudomonas corrugata]|uniref:MurR/RpiR family transcriptional regulator n=1 Tax=Pseudomonas corrugata TaxID=47879 RepID=UPI002856F9FE|nr:MurR/RpiR family transcriptional regulator [Pseudomonas corrugata]MDR7284998.1 DNA-binding MurR/RpiR family transcriptional regulator [Pseudomonas corrugata]
MALPETLAELRDNIAAQHEQLTGRLRDAARFLIDNPHEVALSTVAELGKRSNIAPSAYIRLAQALGFSGFKDLQRLFRAPLQQAADTHYSERIRHYGGETLLEDPSDVGGILREFSQANIVSLEHLAEGGEQANIEAAIGHLQAARTTFVIGMRRAFPVAAYLSYALSRVGQRTVHISGAGGTLPEQVSAIADDDLLIAVSFPPYARDTVEACRQAREAGVTLVAITDSVLSPIGQMADTVIEVNDAELLGFRSLTASFCIAQTLAMGLAFREWGSLSHDRLNDIDC